MSEAPLFVPVIPKKIQDFAPLRRTKIDEHFIAYFEIEWV